MIVRTACCFFVSGFLMTSVVLRAQALELENEDDSAVSVGVSNGFDGEKRPEDVSPDQETVPWEELADVDDNGYIESEEFDNAYRLIDVGIAADRPWREEADTDSDSRVSIEEMRAWRIQMQGD
jgi:hypothetical protein